MTEFIGSAESAGETFDTFCKALDGVSERARSKRELYLNVIADQFLYVGCRVILDSDMGRNEIAEWASSTIQRIEGYYDRDVEQIERLLAEQDAEQKAGGK